MIPTIYFEMDYSATRHYQADSETAKRRLGQFLGKIFIGKRDIIFCLSLCGPCRNEMRLMVGAVIVVAGGRGGLHERAVKVTCE